MNQAKAPRRLVVADDSVLFRRGLCLLLEEAGFEIAGEADDPHELMTRVGADQPDVAIVDIKMPPTFTDEGLRAAEELRDLYPNLGVLVLSQYLEVHYAMRLIENQLSGVGYLLKDRVSAVGEFVDAIHRVAQGESVVDSGVVAELLARKRAVNPLDRLTSREREVLSLMAEGRSNRAIRERLYVSSRTVETHVRNIMMKLGLTETPDDHRRVMAVLAFLRS
ncbi:MAG TPA: response regulator transcription factor [Acidimicrobiia bacterium]|nr:response regulator transcription factor [Acidimicrobiia bacterium]